MKILLNILIWIISIFTVLLTLPLTFMTRMSGPSGVSLPTAILLSSPFLVVSVFAIFFNLRINTKYNEERKTGYLFINLLVSLLPFLALLLSGFSG